ncbi:MULTISPECIES: Rieske 2Fe-2S domain-containing protein [unclassified Leptolyngbya]|uniref:aromatic ring-hydroxylating dioxygenase subunit alpha n=1 Tax=unclassified Leptolyngbya TaxID=2650499 RepID=UPI001685D583|nr:MULTISPECIES: Rieske 2Fe-2S domain-containing protein [unclassified Leptolyngbya]MBD1911811.1 Rieske 2Fe-2S domain-containing protein [Leptolyngbya sp. FACHB-8]MBD2153299.1 Rieske 2Fe-2S domain-containing protein [Leptolyngbya sp. FACHB-16]
MTDSTFNFFQHWYPISPIEDFDPDCPTSVVLLGRRLVVWKPHFSKNYCVFLDQCPHRLAPLSEGRVDEKTGQLMCSYHGWLFDAEGVCTHIPQADDPDLIAKNREHYCATTLPTQEANGLLWVWPDAESAAIAPSHPLPLSPQVDADRGFVWSSMVRDLEYDWQTLVENVSDPSHVPFAHHGVQGNRDKASPVPIKIVKSAQDCIEAKTEGRFETHITFTPPCHLEYAINLGGDRQVGLVTYCIPVSPGKSRIVAQFPRNFAKRLHDWVPRWWNHVSVRNLVLDGDMVLLHYQERDLQQRSHTESWKTAYKLPTSADRMVIEFRRWLDQYGQGQLPWEGADVAISLETRDRQHLLDRYHQHTMICGSCRQALKNVHRLQAGLLAYFFIVLSVAAVMPDELRLRISVPLVLTALFGLGVYAALKYWLEPKFHYVDYVHAKR